MKYNYFSFYLSPFLSNLRRSKKLRAFNNRERLFNLYLADKKILAFNFRILIAYEKWPNQHCINPSGDIVIEENKALKEDLEKIDTEMREYINAHYSLLDLTF